MGRLSKSVVWVSLALLAGCHDDTSHPSVADTGSSGASADGTTGSTSEGSGSADESSSSGGEPTAPPVDAAPGGLRRLRADQYIGTVRALFGPDAAEAATPPADQPLSGFDSIGNAQLPLSPAMVEAYEQSAIAVGKAVATSPAQLSGYIPCITAVQDEGCYVTLAEQLGRIMWRRPLTFDEVDTIVDIARAARATNDDRFEIGLQFEIAMLLQSPDFIYAVELGEEREDGKKWLTTDEWVTRASLFVLGRGPDFATVARIDAGELDGDDAPRMLAQEMLEKPEAHLAVGRFFDELLRVREVVTKSKDATLYPLFTPERAASMREETLRLVQHVVFADESDKNLLGIFDASYSFVDVQLAELYGLPTPTFDGFEKTELPAGQGRLGVLAHPAVLAVNSHHDRNSPTRRGLFVQRSILCNEVPPPPGDVDTTLPEPVEETTLRARMEQHISQGGVCTGCHVQTDPIGFAFEYFDASGVRREEDNGFPIDASGSIDGVGEFQNSAELALLIKDDPRVGPCLVRNLYRHAIGRLEDDGTFDAMMWLSERFAATNQDMQQLMVEMVDNPAFRQVGEPQ